MFHYVTLSDLILYNVINILASNLASLTKIRFPVGVVVAYYLFVILLELNAIISHNLKIISNCSLFTLAFKFTITHCLLYMRVAYSVYGCDGTFYKMR